MISQKAALLNDVPQGAYVEDVVLNLRLTKVVL